MALGGGNWTTQNKILPGTYTNFVSAKRASAILSDRGIVTMPLELDWGEDEKVFTVTQEDFQKNSKTLFGYDYDHEKLKGLRDLFINTRILYAYRVNAGVKSTCTYADAKYSGTRGNDIKIIIAANADDEEKFDVSTSIDENIVDTQTVSESSELIENDWVSFKTSATLAATAGTSLTGGTNGTVTGTSYQGYLNAIESYSFNTMGIVTTDDTTKSLIVAFCKRLRDEMGIKFQCVLNNKASDYIGVINVKNSISDDGWNVASLVYWVTGAEAGCSVNRSVQNKIYDGEFTVNTEYTQTQLENCIKNGEFVLHKVNDDIRVLEDINSFVTITKEQGEDFKDNQCIRVIDQLGNDDAVLFNTKYMGEIPNDSAGRNSLWLDLVKIRQQLQKIRAIQNFTADDVKVSAGETKKSVVVTGNVEPVMAMDKLYMTTTVK